MTIARAPQRIAPARNHHTTFIAQLGPSAFLYVLGGTDSWTSAIYDDVQRSRLASDGTPGDFERIGTLPEPRAGHTSVLVGNRLLVVGGVTDFSRKQQVSSSVFATLGDDGTLSAWSLGPDLPSTAMHHTCDVDGMNVYCVGGRKEGNLTSDLAVRTTLQADGTFSAFQPVTPLPRTRGFHQAFVHGGSLYVLSGLHRDAGMAGFEPLLDALRADIASDGALGPWRTAGGLPAVRQVASATVFRDRVYILGGMDENDQMTDTILSAGFASDASLASAATLPAVLSLPRGHVHQTPMHGRWIYSVGGMSSSEAASDVVDVGTFD